MEEKKVPAIRFIGFNENWEQRKLSEIITEKLSNGIMNHPSEENTDVKHINVINMYTADKIHIEDLTDSEYDDDAIKKCNVEIGDIFLTRSSVKPEGIAEANVLLDSGRFVFDDHLIRMKIDKNKFDALFVKICLGSPLIKKQFIMKSKTTAFTTIGQDDITSCDGLFPVLAEQRKISEFFSNLDNLITLHQRKCEETKILKKYMLQKMFPKNGELFPEIRFEGFTDAWEQRKLGEVCERVTRKNKNGESDLPLTIASQHGLIDQRDFFNKVVAAKDMSNYYLLKKGEFAYNKSYSNGFDYGSIKRLNAYEQGCLSTLYICFGITSDDIESDYLECYFDTLKWYGDVSQICAEGARNHGLLNVDTKAFFDEVTIEMPSSKEEQKKISAYLNNLDNLITLHQRKCDELKIIKKYMLIQMFI